MAELRDETFTLPKCNHGDEKLVEYDYDFTGPGQSKPLRLRDSDRGVVFQISGSATAFEAVVERSTRDPSRETPNWSPAEEGGWAGAASGVAPRVYDEPARGWWRLRVISVIGGTLQLNIIGERA